MQLLHETPVLTPAAFRQTLDPVSPLANLLPPALGVVSADDVADQIEQIKITPEFLSLEEMSKLWTAMQTGYHTSVGYQVSVVLIQSRQATLPALPVRQRQLFVLPFRQPTLNSVSPQLAQVGDKLVLRGTNLRDQNTKINFGAVAAAPTLVTDSRIEVTVPATLQPGVNTVQVVHPLDLGTNQEPHGGFASNAVAFMLVPQISPALPATAARGSTLTVSVVPPVGRTQNAALLLGGQRISIPARPATGPAATSSLDFPLPATVPAGGPFLVRVQVDGTQSQLMVDTNQTSPTFNQYNGPALNLT
jgi:hypothetical protein